MTDHSKTPADCDAVREDLPAWLYDELEGQARLQIERHLNSCSACRADADELRETMQTLDAWEFDISAAIPADSCGASLTWAQRLRPCLTGAAAAVVVFALLGMFGASVRMGEGRLTLSFGRQAPESTNPDLATLVPVMRAAARDEIETRLSGLLDALEVDLRKIGRRHEQERMLLARAVDTRREADLRELAAWLGAMNQRQNEQDVRTRQFERQMTVRRVSLDEDTGNGLND